MIDVTISDLPGKYAALSTKDKGRTIVLEEIEEKPHWVLATFVVNQESVELPPEEVEEFLNKNRSKNIFRIVPDEPAEPEYLRKYDNDSDDIKAVQEMCRELLTFYVKEERLEDAEKLAADIVGYYRISERSGNNVAEIALEAQKALEHYEGLEDDPPPLPVEYIVMG